MIRIGMSLLASMVLAAPAAMANERLFTMIDDRLEWMKDVAAYKHAQSKPVEDVEREQIVLGKTVEQAKLAGLSPDSAERFFAAQIEAAKDIQRCWISRWTNGEELPPDEFRDLTAEVRPALIELGNQIIETLGTNAPVPETLQPDYERLVDVECLSQDSRSHMFEQLLEVRPIQ